MSSSMPPPRPRQNFLAKPDTSNATLTELQTQVARQHMVIQALCHLLIAKGVMDETELNEWASYVDKLDGRADGQLHHSGRPVTCQACRRISPPGAVRCQYCGEEVETSVLVKGE